MTFFRRRQFYITQVEKRNYASLAEIHAMGFERPWNQNEIAATLAGKGVTCLVAKIYGQGSSGPRGFVIMRSAADQSEILTLAINPKFRRIGMATALMEQAIRQLRSDRVTHIFLEVSEYNQAALNLYQSLKFKPIFRREAYYATHAASGKQCGHRANALVMQLELV